MRGNGGESEVPGMTLPRGELPTDSSSAAAQMRLGVVGANRAWLANLRRALPAQSSLQLIAVSDLASIMRVGSTWLEWDVAVAFLSAGSLQSLTDILGFHDRLGRPELVAVAESPNDAAVVALRELGMERILSQD